MRAKRAKQLRRMAREDAESDLPNNVYVRGADRQIRLAPTSERRAVKRLKHKFNTSRRG